MDKEQLKAKLTPWMALNAKNGYPLQDLCLEEAFPGVAGTSYAVRVRANWVDNMSCSDALDILIDAMWETVAEEDRKFVFYIDVHDSSDELHCQSNELQGGSIEKEKVG